MLRIICPERFLYFDRKRRCNDIIGIHVLDALFVESLYFLALLASETWIEHCLCGRKYESDQIPSHCRNHWSLLFERVRHAVEMHQLQPHFWSNPYFPVHCFCEDSALQWYISRSKLLPTAAGNYCLQSAGCRVWALSNAYLQWLSLINWSRNNVRFATEMKFTNNFSKCMVVSNGNEMCDFPELEKKTGLILMNEETAQWNSFELVWRQSRRIVWRS